MTGMELFVWESYRELYGTTVPMGTIIEELKRYSCPSILLLCSNISVRLQLGLRDAKFASYRLHLIAVEDISE
jgi:hypothetical protein